jgi:malate permease and related proteins
LIILNEPVTLLRILSIVFPVFAIALVGWIYGKQRNVDMTSANQSNVEIFVPALVFSALANRSFDLAGHQTFAIGAFCMIIGCGLLGWLIARICHIPSKVLVPSIMFNNSANLGLPVAMLAFGEQGLAAAVVMFVVANLVHFSFGNWFLDHHAKWWLAWRYPVILAAIAGLCISLLGITLWEPLRIGIKMLGDVSIPLALFSLGIRIAQSHPQSLRIGLIGAIARPVSGILLTWLLALALGLQGQDKAILIIYGALPPAMINYIFAERYHQGPDEVAAIVLIGNIAAIAVLPIVLAVVL